VLLTTLIKAACVLVADTWLSAQENHLATA
jgi:hypothetical protein